VVERILALPAFAKGPMTVGDDVSLRRMK